MEEAQTALEIEEQSTDTPPEHPTNNNGIPMVSQDMEEVEKDEEGPATRMRARAATRTITQEVLLQMTDVSGNGSAITAKSAASRKFPMQFLCNYANAVLDGKTGELLEYRHLIAHSKYKQAWGASFGNEIGRLAQGMPSRVEGTDTMFL